MSLLLLLRPSAATAYTLTCETGVYTFTGQNANLNKSKLLVAQAGSYSLTGNNATLLKSKRIVAETGSYSFVGNNANLTWSGTGNAYTLTCLTGSYSLVGQSAVLKRSRRIVAESGVYSFVGNSVVLTYTSIAPEYPEAGIAGFGLFDDDIAINQFDTSMNIAQWFDEMMTYSVIEVVQNSIFGIRKSASNLQESTRLNAAQINKRSNLQTSRRS